MLIAPGWFLRELEIFDSELRCRWSNITKSFHLERKVANSLPPTCYKTDTEHDDYIRARDGYLLVGIINPDGFGRGIFDKLRASDLWSNGGWEKAAKEIEEYEENNSKKHDENFARDMHDLSHEVYKLLKIRDGRSIYSAGFKS